MSRFEGSVLSEFFLSAQPADKPNANAAQQNSTGSGNNSTAADKVAFNTIITIETIIAVETGDMGGEENISLSGCTRRQHCKVACDSFARCWQRYIESQRVLPGRACTISRHQEMAEAVLITRAVAPACRQIKCPTAGRVRNIFVIEPKTLNAEVIEVNWIPIAAHNKSVNSEKNHSRDVISRYVNLTVVDSVSECV